MNVKYLGFSQWKSHLKGGCGVNRMDGESNESVYERLAMSVDP